GAGSGVVGMGFRPAPPVRQSSSGAGGAGAGASASEGASTGGAGEGPSASGDVPVGAGRAGEGAAASDVSAGVLVPGQAGAGASVAGADAVVSGSSVRVGTVEDSEGAGQPEGARDAGRAADTAAADHGPAVLSGHLDARTVKSALQAVEKEAAVREMAELLAGSGRVTDVDELVATALRREEQGTTGLGEEIAVPHAKTDAVTAPVVGFARSAEGVEWGSLDGTKARLVFMIAVPEAAAGDEHLRILALLSRKLMDPGFRERLLAAPDEGAMLDVLGEVG
ncbi:PTS sugar transporter subunit IIA, partial [Streptomyces puniciscabiei]